MKSEGVRDIVTWMQAEIKKQKVEVLQAQAQRSAMGHFEDCGDYYHESLAREEAKLRVMVEWKISTEKYMKKLIHEGQ